jgi:acid phosphatase
MKALLRLFAILAAGCGLLSACQFPAPVGNAADGGLDATLWFQTSAEYRAAAGGIYREAERALAGAAREAGEKPPAVILDVDETVLDNSPYQAQLVLNGANFSEATWDDWVSRGSAAAVPGAVEFVNRALAFGIRVVYVTNRACGPRPRSPDRCAQKTDTIANLRRVGIKHVAAGDVLLRGENGWGSEKESRRRKVEETHRIVLLIGDQLSDFVAGTSSLPASERIAVAARYAERWGTTWFMLPNPVYGDWARPEVVGRPKTRALRGY